MKKFGLALVVLTVSVSHAQNTPNFFLPRTCPEDLYSSPLRPEARRYPAGVQQITGEHHRLNAGGKGEVQAKTVAVVNAEGLITQEQSLYPEGSRSIVWYTYSPEGNLLSMAEDFLFPGEVPDPKQLPKPEFTLVWEQGKPIRKELGGTGMISSAEHYTHEGSGLKTLIRETITFKDVISTIDKVLISSTLSPHKAGGFVVVNLYQEFKQQKPGPVLPLSECRYSSEGWLLSKVIQPTAEHAGERLTYIYPRVSEGVWLERQEQYELFNTQGVLRRSPINVIVRNLIRNSTP